MGLIAGDTIADDLLAASDEYPIGDSDMRAAYDADYLAFELGAWLAGIDSYLRSGEYGDDAATRDMVRELRLVRSGLLRCAQINFRLQRSATRGSSAADVPERSRRLGRLLGDSIILCDSVERGVSVDLSGWVALSAVLSKQIGSSADVRSSIRSAEASGDAYLPDRLLALISDSKLEFEATAEVRTILPQFARILKWLSIVGKMLRNDEPLKPALLIFARVREQTSELVDYMDRRLSRFPDETAELFGSIDGASYTAALELKKVYNQELVGVAGVRPAPSVYARMETAYSLLNDSFQQIVAGFARLIEPEVSAIDLYPNLRVKLDQSLLLRDDLATVLRVVQRAEQEPNPEMLARLKTDLTGLLDNTMRYLFYKDRETIERFGEEIFAAGDKKDLGPILHRFGAYLETLFGQVNMRTVLADHPFEDSDI